MPSSRLERLLPQAFLGITPSLDFLPILQSSLQKPLPPKALPDSSSYIHSHRLPTALRLSLITAALSLVASPVWSSPLDCDL